jgi:hypothetical protein
MEILGDDPGSLLAADWLSGGGGAGLFSPGTAVSDDHDTSVDGALDVP